MSADQIAGWGLGLIVYVIGALVAGGVAESEGPKHWRIPEFLAVGLFWPLVVPAIAIYGLIRILHAPKPTLEELEEDAKRVRDILK